MEIKCALVKDLMPLYIESLCSDYTKGIVEEHIAHCQDCQRILSELNKQNIPNTTKIETKKSIKPFKKVKRRNLLVTVASVFSVITIIAIIIVKLFFIGSTAPLSAINVKAIEMLDEMTFSIELSSNSSTNSINNIYLMPSDHTGNVYIKINRVLVSPFRTNDDYVTSFGFDSGALGRDSIKAVYLVGKSEDDIQLIWEE